ncbi:MAG: CAP domain-containing protein [Actinobacteria bacterium]|nr:CAP domain-containing protein [Actinomycetota bacterium]
MTEITVWGKVVVMIFNLLVIITSFSFLVSLNSFSSGSDKKANKLSESIIEKSYAKGLPEVKGKTSKNSLNADVVEEEVPLEMLITPTAVPTVVPVVQEQSPKDDWGKAQQLTEHTWTIKVGQDGQLAGAQEIFNALNNYRNNKGKGSLGWEQSLADFAKTRADQFNREQKLDDHAGFMSYFSQDKMREMGLRGAGENSAVGYNMTGTHLIEWVFAGDPDHDGNQLNSAWNVVGIATSGNAVNFIFGTK